MQEDRLDTSTYVVLLGTGTPNADPDRSGPALAVVVSGTPYLVDCGPGVVRRAAAAGLNISTLSRAFVTHLHSDHTAGYPDLILTPWVLERSDPLQVYGPPGLRAMTEHILLAYGEDIRQRLDGVEPANGSGHVVQAVESGLGVVYEDDKVEVRSFAVNHGSWPAYGYRFTTPDGIVVISGDTAPFWGWEKAYAGADLLVHEVYSAAGFAGREPVWQRYHAAMHTSSQELAAVAALVRPGVLVLTHQLYHGVSDQDLVDEVRFSYDGKVVSGRDLEAFRLETCCCRAQSAGSPLTG